MTHTVLLWLQSSLYVAGLYALASTVTSLRGTRSANNSMTIGMPRSTVSKNRGTVIINNIFLVIVGFLLGFGSRDMLQFRHTYELDNVHVIRQLADNMYLMETPQQSKFVMKFCADFKPQFEPDSLLTTIKYEQQPGCVSVASAKHGFKVLRDGLGHPVRISEKQQE